MVPSLQLVTLGPQAFGFLDRVDPSVSVLNCCLSQIHDTSSVMNNCIKSTVPLGQCSTAFIGMFMCCITSASCGLTISEYTY